MSCAPKIQEIPVMFVCEKDMFVVVPKSLLVKESSFFKSKLSCNWQGSHSENSGEKTNVDNEDHQTGIDILIS